MKSRATPALLVALLVAIAAYWYWSPVLAIQQMRKAAEARNAATFNNYIDFPKVRESLKGQFTAALTKPLVKQQEPESDFGTAGAALGTMLGLSIVDKMVDAFITPEMVMRAMQEGKMTPKESVSGAATPPSGSTARSEEARWTSERVGFDKYLTHATAPDDPAKKMSLVFERSGFAQWKLTGVRLPLD